MKKIILTLVALVALAVVGITAFNMAGGNASTAPVASVTEPVTVPPPETTQTVETPTAELVSYELTGASLIEFTGYKLVGSQTGSFILFDGTIALQGDDPTTAQMTCSVDIDSMETKSQTLTDIMKSDKMFDSEQFPEAEFRSTGVTATDTGFSVAGVLTIKEVEKAFTFPATITVADDAVHLKAEFQVDRNWWGISWDGFGDNIMKDMALIKLDIVAEKTP